MLFMFCCYVGNKGKRKHEKGEEHNGKIGKIQGDLFAKGKRI